MRIGDGLIRAFVKNSEHTEDAGVRAAYGTLAGVTDILCNVFLFAVKFTAGLIMASTAVTADAFNNLSDAFSSVVSLVGVRVASRPADEEHPFGHGRIEYAASLIVAVVIIVVGVEFFRTSVDKILHPTALTVSVTAVIFLVLSILVKFWMYLFNRNIGKRMKSTLFSATAADAAFDMLTTAVTLVSVVVYAVLRVNIDGICGLIVSVVVIWAGIGIAKDMINPLIGEPMPEEFRERMEKTVTEIPGVEGVHDLIVHNYGPGRYMATIHAEVSRKMSLDEAHAIADKAERKVKKEMNVFLVVHIDPVEIHDQKVMEIREKISGIIKDTDPSLSFHDFHVKHGKTDRNELEITFDLCVPYAYSEEKENETAYRIMDSMRRENPRWHCVITIDRGMVPETSISSSGRD